MIGRRFFRKKEAANRVSWRQQLGRSHASRWSTRLLFGLILIGVLADFLANDKPLLASYQGQVMAPVAKQYLVDLGLSQWPADLVLARWSQVEFDWSIWPPVPYSAERTDMLGSFLSPFGSQDAPSGWSRHWLGTDAVGRDVAAGLIHGTRIALAVGLISMSIALLLGLVFGSLAGYFGDDGLRTDRASLAGGTLGLFPGYFFGFVAPHPVYLSGSYMGWLLFGGIVLVLSSLLGVFLFRGLRRFDWWRQRVRLPIDSLVLRVIEIFNSVPSLLLLLAVLAILPEPNIFYVMAILGLLSWTGIARFVRAELLRIRRLEYIEAARVLGYREGRILLRHALPNALGPVWVSLAFGIAGAVLAEAYLSFLGIGLPPNTVSWGSLLRQARDLAGAWWLAVFPGLAIFTTVLIFNILGEALTRRK